MIFENLVFAGMPHIVRGIALNQGNSFPSTDTEIQITGNLSNFPEDKISVFAGTDGKWALNIGNHENSCFPGDLYNLFYKNINPESIFFGDSAQEQIQLTGGAIDDVGDKSLPVFLSDFYAVKTSRGIKLVWRTEAEIDNSGFEIYRDNKKIIFIAGAGNSAMPREYIFLDKNPGSKYSLAQVDISGKKTKLKTIFIILPQAMTWAKIKQS